jgi:hypothetical protein
LAFGKFRFRLETPSFWTTEETVKPTSVAEGIKFPRKNWIFYGRFSC